MHTDHPDLIVGARMNVPLIVGLGEGEGFLASDVPAILEHTRRMVILHEGDIAAVTPTGTRVVGLDGDELDREVTEITWNLEAAEKGGFAHFTLKEIYEQPHAIQEALRAGSTGRRPPPARARRPRGQLAPQTGSISSRAARRTTRPTWAPTSSSNGAGCRRYRSSVRRCAMRHLRSPTLVIAVSQSGETADDRTHASARERGAVVVVTNVVGSALTRDGNATVYLQAGPEIGVASTKAFVAQVLVLQMIALHLAQLRGTMSAAQLTTFGLGLRVAAGGGGPGLRRAGP